MELDSAYRRGTVFGLTIAEIFILLIFLVLLALLGLAGYWQEREKEYEAQRERHRGREQILSEWRDVIEFHTPDQIKNLIRKMPSLEQENQNLRRKNENLRKRTEDSERETERAREKEGEAKEKQERLKRELDEEKRKVKRVEEDARARKKGQNPPCWYETVDDVRGGTREKPHYLFNIAVYDDAIVVLPHPIPPGGAEDDDGPPYAEEAKSLSLDSMRYGEPLSDSELVDDMRDIYNRGRNAEVRSYDCTFYVKVWDRTSSGAKARWKEAHHEVLEGLFGTYVVRDDPWPESP